MAGLWSNSRSKKPAAGPSGSATSRAAKLTRVQLAIGLSVTLIMALLQLAGLTRQWEYPFFDFRSKAFSFFKQPLTDQVVVVLIDDQATETIGRWPWPRERIAQATDELGRAGASVIAFDILFHDPQRPEIRGDPAHCETIQTVDHNRLLADAYARHGGVLQGVSLNYISPREAAKSEAKEVPFARVHDLVSDQPGITVEEARRKLLPDEAPLGPKVEDLARKVAGAKVLVESQHAVSLPIPDKAILWPLSNDPKPPLPVIAGAAASMASVSFGRGDPDGLVRRIPIWAKVRDRLYPTLGLRAALMQMKLPIGAIRAARDRTTIESSDGATIVIPTHAALLGGLIEQGDIDGLCYIPWPRGGWGGWESQFAVRDESGRLKPTEISLGSVLDPQVVMAPNIRRNIAAIDALMMQVNAMYGLGQLDGYAERSADLAAVEFDDPWWARYYENQKQCWLAGLGDGWSLLDMNKGVDLSALTPAECTDLENIERFPSGLLELLTSIDDGIRRIAARRADLKKQLEGKICFVGYSYTGAIADFVTTSIGPRTPGVHVHAAMANAILGSRDRSQFVHGVPWWVNLGVLLLLGSIGTLLAVKLGVVLSPIAVVCVLGAWFAFDGIVLWDWGKLFVAEGAAFLALGASWLAVILHRLLVEQRGRKQTEARFRSYVSPDVVDILVNNPGLSSMEPVRRELTIFFSDIASWTTLAERLGTEGIGKFLATYLKAMTDILQSHRATIDKYLGDGIMAFWGAPVEDPDHARHAVEAVIEMQEKLRQMNEAGDFGPAGSITVRIGLAAGEVNVGDFGNPPDKSAYTVIGDAANLAARLESANKQFGSLILISDRVRELMKFDAPMRLMGRVIVKGKTEPETLWEPIGSRRPKGDRTDAWIELNNRAVGAYIAGDFKAARQMFDELERDFDEVTLADLYRHSMDAIDQSGGPGSAFDGALVLKEK